MQLTKQDANGRRYIVYCCDRCGEILEGAHSCSPNPVIEQLQRRIAELELTCKDHGEIQHSLCDQLAAAQAKVAWMEGNTPNWGGWPWDAPYNDGYETAKAEFRKEIVAVEEQLAAAQAREAKYREALEMAESAFDECKDYPITHDMIIEALAQTEVK